MRRPCGKDSLGSLPNLRSGGLIKREVCVAGSSEVRNEGVEPENKASRNGFDLLILLKMCEITHTPLSWESRKMSPQLAQS